MQRPRLVLVHLVPSGQAEQAFPLVYRGWPTKFPAEKNKKKITKCKTDICSEKTNQMQIHSYVFLFRGNLKNGS